MRLLRSERFGLILDFFILAAVVITDEVTRVGWFAFFGTLVLVLVLRSTSEKPRQRFAVGGFFALLLFGLGLNRGWWSERTAPLWVALQLAPCFVALGYSLPTTVRSVGFRLGIQFVVLALACLAQPELSTGIILLAWFFGLPLVLMVLFSESRGVDPGIRIFFGVWGKMVLILVLMAAMIFPFLPRFETTGFYGNTVGYSETVSTEGKNLSDAKPVTDWWVLGDHGLDQVRLLRGRVLDRWIGTRLESGTFLTEKNETGVTSNPSTSELLTLVAARSFPSRSLPIPYGYAPWGFSPSLLHEYRNETTAKTFPLTKALAFQDEPSAKDLDVPQVLKTPEVLRLASRVHSPEELSRYFQLQGFTAVLNSQAKSLEEFLFRVRQGNCQYFSLSSLVLLRLSGIPTRMIAGYRVTRPALAGVLSLRTQDAHAWVEVWNSSKKVWIPFDSTPMQMQDLSWAKRLSLYFRDLSDAAYGIWNKYVLGFDQQAVVAQIQSMKSQVKQRSEMAGYLAATALILILLFLRFRSVRRSAMSRLWIRYEKTLAQKGPGDWSRRWTATYECHRFGRPSGKWLLQYRQLRLSRLLN